MKFKSCPICSKSLHKAFEPNPQGGFYNFSYCAQPTSNNNIPTPIPELPDFHFLQTFLHFKPTTYILKFSNSFTAYFNIPSNQLTIEELNKPQQSFPCNLQQAIQYIQKPNQLKLILAFQ